LDISVVICLVEIYICEKLLWIDLLYNIIITFYFLFDMRKLKDFSDSNLYIINCSYWILPRDATQSAVLLWQVVCLSVCLSVRNVEVL